MFDRKNFMLAENNFLVKQNALCSQATPYLHRERFVLTENAMCSQGTLSVHNEHFVIKGNTVELAIVQ